MSYETRYAAGKRAQAAQRATSPDAIAGTATSQAAMQIVAAERRSRPVTPDNFEAELAWQDGRMTALTAATERAALMRRFPRIAAKNFDAVVAWQVARLTAGN